MERADCLKVKDLLAGVGQRVKIIPSEKEIHGFVVCGMKGTQFVIGDFESGEYLHIEVTRVDRQSAVLATCVIKNKKAFEKTEVSVQVGGTYQLVGSEIYFQTFTERERRFNMVINAPRSLPIDLMRTLFHKYANLEGPTASRRK